MKSNSPSGTLRRLVNVEHVHIELYSTSRTCKLAHIQSSVTAFVVVKNLRSNLFLSNDFGSLSFT